MLPTAPTPVRRAAANVPDRCANVRSQPRGHGKRRLSAGSARGLPPRPPPSSAAAATLSTGPVAPPSPACRAPTGAPGCVRRGDAAPLNAAGPTVCALAAEEAVPRPSTCHGVRGDAAAMAPWGSPLAVAGGGCVAVAHTAGDGCAGRVGSRDEWGKDASRSPAAACAWCRPDHDVPPVDR